MRPSTLLILLVILTACGKQAEPPKKKAAPPTKKAEAKPKPAAPEATPGGAFKMFFDAQTRRDGQTQWKLTSKQVREQFAADLKRIQAKLADSKTDKLFRDSWLRRLKVDMAGLQKLTPEQFTVRRLNARDRMLKSYEKARDSMKVLGVEIDGDKATVKWEIRAYILPEGVQRSSSKLVREDGIWRMAEKF